MLDEASLMLDGGGRLSWPYLRHYLRAKGLVSHNLLEAFAGEGYWAINALAENFAHYATLSDIKPEAKEAQERLARELKQVRMLRGQFTQKITSHTGDVLEGLLGHFDLVIANAPSYSRVSEQHSLYPLVRNDLRVHDPEWQLRRRFYKAVYPHLKEGATILMLEVEPFSSQVYLCGQLYDDRGTAPHDLFVSLVEDTGLKYISTEPFCRLEEVTFYLMRSTREPKL